MSRISKGLFGYCLEEMFSVFYFLVSQFSALEKGFQCKEQNQEKERVRQQQQHSHGDEYLIVALAPDKRTMCVIVQL